MPNPLHIGLVGCGRWGRLILRDLRALGCDVSVVARSASSISNARQGGATTVAERIENLADADGVVVATTIDSHAAIVGEVVALGVPVFVEKPLTSDADSARRIAEAHGERVFVMDKWRYHPGVVELARRSATGEMGQVLAVHTRRRGWGNTHADADACWVLAPHDLSIIDAVLGVIPPVRGAVAVHRGAWVDELAAVLGDRVDDHPVATVDLSSLAIDADRRVEVVGSEATAVLAGGWDEHISVLHRGAHEPEAVPTPGELPLLAELREFVEHLRGGPAPRATAHDGARVVTAIEELRRRAGVPTQ